MDDVDKVLDALKVHIKKEIVDNYFADRVYVEEDTELLGQEVQDYARSMASLGRRFMALYHALGSQGSLRPDDGGPEARALAILPGVWQAVRPGTDGTLLSDTRRRGFTAYRRFRNLICDLLPSVQQESLALRETYAKSPDAPEAPQRRHQQVQPVL